jgi:hypothetical protein
MLVFTAPFGIAAIVFAILVTSSRSNGRQSPEQEASIGAGEPRPSPPEAPGHGVDKVTEDMLAVAVHLQQDTWPICKDLGATHACGRALAALAARHLREAIKYLRGRTVVTIENVKLEKVYEETTLAEHLTKMYALQEVYQTQIKGLAARCCRLVPDAAVLLADLRELAVRLGEAAIRPADNLRREIQGDMVLSEGLRGAVVDAVTSQLGLTPKQKAAATAAVRQQATLAQVRGLAAKPQFASAKAAIEDGINKAVSDAVQVLLFGPVRAALLVMIQGLADLEGRAADVQTGLRTEWSNSVREIRSHAECGAAPMLGVPPEPATR